MIQSRVRGGLKACLFLAALAPLASAEDFRGHPSLTEGDYTIEDFAFGCGATPTPTSWTP